MAHRPDRRDGSPGAVNILHRRDLAQTEKSGGDVEARRTELIDDYEAELLNPYQAAELGYIDAVIEPAETRWQVAKALRATFHKRETLPAKKHGNIPL